MKKFFQDCFDTTLKMIVTQLGMTMFGLMLTMATRALPGAADKKNDSSLLLVGGIAVFLYMFLLYTHVWDKGAKDKIKVDSGRMTNMPLKGLYMSLMANSLNIILGLIMCSTFYFCDFVNAPNSIACQVFGSANDIARLIQGMYTGLIIYISPNASSTNPFLFLAIVLPALFISTFGYYMGLTNRRIIKVSQKTKK